MNALTDERFNAVIEYVRMGFGPDAIGHDTLDRVVRRWNELNEQDAAAKVPALVPDQPAGCQCAPNSWGVEGYMPICQNYEPCQFGDCKHCNHDEACHS